MEWNWNTLHPELSALFEFQTGVCAYEEKIWIFLFAAVCLEPKAAESSECPVLMESQGTPLDLFFLFIECLFEAYVCFSSLVAPVDSWKLHWDLCFIYQMLGICLLGHQNKSKSQVDLAEVWKY